MEVRSSDRQVIDEYTLSGENIVTVYTHKWDGLGSQLRELLSKKK